MPRRARIRIRNPSFGISCTCADTKNLPIWYPFPHASKPNLQIWYPPFRPFEVSPSVTLFPGAHLAGLSRSQHASRCSRACMSQSSSSRPSRLRRSVSRSATPVYASIFRFTSSLRHGSRGKASAQLNRLRSAENDFARLLFAFSISFRDSTRCQTTVKIGWPPPDSPTSST